jgi:myo-inositol 2-dehydrogenase / D-chiro-inositol 1-dehydrogenase
MYNAAHGFVETTMSSGNLRIGIVGTGLMGLEHINSLKLSPDAEVVAIADPTPMSLAWAQGLLGERAARVGVYPDVREMIAAGGLDAVFVASPNHTHHDVLQPLLDTDLHILCEKPLCSTVADAARIAEKASRHRGVFWVGMEYRFMPPAAAFVAAVHEGRVGRLVMLAMREHRFPFLTKVGDWNRFSRNTGGTMVEKCCHFFDLMRLIVRSEAVRVYCSGAMDVNHLDERYDGERPDIIDNSYTVVDFANGVRAMLDLSMFAEGSERQEELAAVGDKAKLEVFIPPGELVFSPRTPLGAPKKVTRELIEVNADALAAGSHFGATYFQHRAFIDAVRAGGPAQVTADDGLQAVAIGAAAELSAREKRAVDMTEILTPG